MTDTMTPEQRHRCMSHIRSKATKPELLVRQWLWSHGYRYRLNVKSVPGKPDIVLRPYRTAIFVNGCFWHGHQLRFAQMYDVRGMKLEEPRSGNNLRSSESREQSQASLSYAEMKECRRSQDPRDLASAEREQENKYIPSSPCCKIPQTNRSFWVEKIHRNQKRDQRNYALLQDNGWQVIVVWECQLKSDKIERTMREVELLLNENLLSLYKHSPISYSLDEDETLPMAAEEGLE